MNRVEMMNALTGFNTALKAGAIEVRPTRTDPKIFVHADTPDGTPRLSYVRMKGSHATAIAVIVVTEPLDGLPAMHIGCAVREDQRGKGIGRHVLSVALEDFRTNMAPKGMKDIESGTSISRQGVVPLRPRPELGDVPVKVENGVGR